MGYYINKINNISIHAPTRGATNAINYTVMASRFQSTLLQEERLSSSDFANVFDYFNPRSYKRSDFLVS